MGKEKKRRTHQSLTEQILEVSAPVERQITKTKLHNSAEHSEAGDDAYVGEKLSHKILHQAMLQQEQLEEEHGIARPLRKSKGRPLVKKVALSESGHKNPESEEEFEDITLDEETQHCCPVINEKDEEALKLFMNPDKCTRNTLADVILEKIRDRETEIATHVSGCCQSVAPELDEKVISLFKSVGQILTKYRSGKLPKAFKVIPSLPNWEEMLHLTAPEKWSAAAMFQATRIFASNLSASKTQRFYNLVLLPRVRDDISEYKRLNFHLYMALKKALFKPAAFFKGILLPLCESTTCTLREAVIISSVMAKTSIPMLHSSAALLKIAEMDYCGANSVFLRTLLDKKYALPYRVVDAVVFHFVRFTSDSRALPVLWHQSLLTFVQRYKEDISVEQKEALLELIRGKTHSEITPEIRREIVQSRCRDLGEFFVSRNVGMQVD